MRMRRLLEALILPPSSVLVLILGGTALRHRLPRTGRTLQIVGLLWLWLAATPFVAGTLLRTLQDDPPLPASGPLPQADAIVVLSAAADRIGAEYGGPVAGAMTMQRLRYGAALQRRTGLPILVSGGRPGSNMPSMAELMARALRDEFQVPVRWLEERSYNTAQNAEFSAEILVKAGARRILLVSTAWHLPRAAESFQRHGIEVVPAPTAFRGPPYENYRSLLPHWAALRDTGYAMHEWFGRVYYALFA